jgi:hypothetical protein
MSANDEAWRRPPDRPGNQTPGGPAAPQPSPPAPRPAPRPEDTAWARPLGASGGAGLAGGSGGSAGSGSAGSGSAGSGSAGSGSAGSGSAGSGGSAAGSSGEPSANGAGPATPVIPEYTGPPRTNAPPAAWRPPIVAEPPPPGTLPEQDHDRIDVEEQAARTLTTGVGLVVGAVCLVLLLVLCARALF